MVTKMSPAVAAAKIAGEFKNVRGQDGPITVRLLAADRKALRGSKAFDATKTILDTRGNYHEIPRCQGTSARGRQCERGAADRGPLNTWNIRLASDDQRAYCAKHVEQHVSVKVLAAKAKAKAAPAAMATEAVAA